MASTRIGAVVETTSFWFFWTITSLILIWCAYHLSGR